MTWIEDFAALSDWYQQSAGKKIESAASEFLKPTFASVFGFHALQIGLTKHKLWLANSPVQCKIFGTVNPNNFTGSIILDCYDLPFPDNSIDCVFIPHLLEFVPDKERLLKEIYRVLVAEGHLIHLGFNPISLLIIHKILRTKLEPIVSPSTWLRYGKILNLLNQEQFTVLERNCFYFRPLSHHDENNEKLLFLESAGATLWPMCGGLNIVVAKKIVSTATPIKPLLKFKNYVIGKQLAPEIS